MTLQPNALGVVINIIARESSGSMPVDLLIECSIARSRVIASLGMQLTKCRLHNRDHDCKKHDLFECVESAT